MISTVLKLQQQLRTLKFDKWYRSNRTLKSDSTAASLPDEGDEVYVPMKAVASPIDRSKVEKPPVFDKALITHLERLSLIRFSDEEAVFNLREAVQFANQLKLIDTTGVEPLETLLEDIPCPLRDDVPNDPTTKAEVLMNATEIVEDYFVVPLGNIPLEESDKLDMAKVQSYGQKVTDTETLLKDSLKNKSD